MGSGGYSRGEGLCQRTMAQAFSGLKLWLVDEADTACMSRFQAMKLGQAFQPLCSTQTCLHFQKASTHSRASGSDRCQHSTVER